MYSTNYNLNTCVLHCPSHLPYITLIVSMKCSHLAFVLRLRDSFDTDDQRLPPTKRES